MRCEYDHNCQRPATYLMSTKVGDFRVCEPHAKVGIYEKWVRYIEPLYKSVLDRISESLSVT